MISICMIVKDESEILENSLKSISKYGYEIIIVDTGSTDNTKDIAYKYTDKVYDFIWEKDFSKARNFSIDKASNEYILVLDADEVVINTDKKLLEKNICKDKVGRILIVNRYSNNSEIFESREKISRFFCKSLFKYEGIIHEQIVSKSGEDYLTYDIPVTIEHSGYEKKQLDRKDKINRNIELLKSELEIKGLDPYILYQLGKSYYVEKNYEMAEHYFSRVIDFDLNTKLEYVQDMIECYGYTLINQDKCKEAMSLLGVYSEFNNSADFVFLVGHIYMNNGYFDKAIEEFEKAKKYKNCKTKGVNDYLANYNIGLILECLGKIDEAIKYYEKSKCYKLSTERIKLLTKGSIRDNR
ncbi:glycosyltransferase [Clostridium sp. BL-8]|uniref:glycosyltransferase n=1 Tax=Clostridium sp. BL-8 TaxID=349938 RepID=UPI00098C8217|nr:glycosyltransferase [Clostridium sp. BL-8]OOM79972.1 SPBc2 prophage-derived glycosyltransferase SunS [Clostridium sp. BL-8]